MARQEIDLTTPQPNGKMGEPTKAAWEKVNDMTAEIYNSPGMSGFISGENMLINCGIPINQRQFSGGDLAAGAYGYDRWKAGAGGCNLSINSSNGVFTHNSGSIEQVIELPVSAWGQPVTFSVENPSGTISVNVGGSSGTISAGIGRRGVTVTPSGSGNMVVQITAASVTYIRPKLEIGSVATPFFGRSPALELLICKRYYWRSGDFTLGNYMGVISGFIPAGSQSIASVGMFFPVPMRAKPTITTFNPNDSSSTTGLVIGSNNVAYQSIDYDGSGIYQVNFSSPQVQGGSFILKVSLDAEL